MLWRIMVHGMKSLRCNWPFMLVLLMTVTSVANSSPNFIVIIDDQHNRRYMNWTGQGEGIQTPNLDRLASEGVAFTNAYAAVPQCAPARHSLYTGRYASEHGVLQNDRMLRAGIPTLQDILSSSGYTTASIGKLHYAPYNERLGFQYILNHEFYQDPAGISHFFPFLVQQVQEKGIQSPRFPAWNLAVPQRTWTLTPKELAFEYDLPADLTSEHWVTQQSLSFLNDQSINRPDKPFFLHVSYFAPHHPYAPVKIFNKYVAKDMVLPPSWSEVKAAKFQKVLRGIYGISPWTASDYQDIKAHYFGSISQVDFEVGDLLKWLDDHPAIAANTIVFFMSDHGDMMGEHGKLFKGNMYEGSAGVPFIIRWPGIVPRQESAPVSHIDVMPTILTAAGISNPLGLPGKSLFPLLSEGDPNQIWAERPVISEYFSGARFPWRQLMVRWTRFKLIAERKSTNLLDGYYYYLFDLSADPWEMHDLVDNLNYNFILDHMKRMLDEHIARQTPFLPPTMPPKTQRCTWNIQLLYQPWTLVAPLHCP